MEVRRFLSIAAATAVVGTAVLMTGCGSDDSSSASSVGSNSASFDKARVPGIKYNLANATGGNKRNSITGANGTFRFNNNDTVTFDLGMLNTTMGQFNNSEYANTTDGNLDVRAMDFVDASGTIWTVDGKKNFKAFFETQLKVRGYDFNNQTQMDSIASLVSDLITGFEDYATNGTVLSGINTGDTAVMKAVTGDLTAKVPTAKNGTINSTVAEAEFDDSYNEVLAAIETADREKAASESISGFNSTYVNNVVWFVRNNDDHTNDTVTGWPGTAGYGNKTTSATYNVDGGSFAGAMFNNSYNKSIQLISGAYDVNKKFMASNSSSNKEYTIMGIAYNLTAGGINTSASSNYTMNLTGLGSFKLSNATWNNAFNNGTWNGTWSISDDGLTLMLAGADNKTNKTVAFKYNPRTEGGFYAYVWNFFFDKEKGLVGGGNSSIFYDATNSGVLSTTGTWE